MKRFLLPVLAAAAASFASAGCYTRGDVGVGYSYGYAAAAPEMYVMGNGVSVVAYSDYPTFYSDNYYWQYNNGLWYRSSYYGGGWAVSYDVPYGVRSIDRPYSYARFTPGRGWARANVGGSYNGGYRDHRRGTYNGGYRPTPPPTAGGYRPPPTGGGYRPPPTGGGYNPPPTRGGGYSPPPRAVPPSRTYSPPPPSRGNAPPPTSGPRAPYSVPRGGPGGNPNRR